MKLQDLAAPQKTKQVAKVMESYFGNSVAFDQLSQKQAQAMLTKVRGLIAEQRRQPGFHSSEQNPAYLKLVVMEQGLASKLKEAGLEPTASAAGGVATPAAKVNPAQMGMEIAKKKKEIQDQIKNSNLKLDIVGDPTLAQLAIIYSGT